MCKSRAIGFAILLVCSLASSARATVILTMDDLPNQPVNGLVHPSGVSFGFTVGGIASLDARYNSGGPGITSFITDPSIEGSASGVLNVVFPIPYNSIRFGLAASTNSSTSVNVELFDLLNVSLGTTPLNIAPVSTFFSEAEFVYSGARVSRFRLDLTPASATPLRFAFDNLRLNNVAAIPEPGSFTVFLMGSLGIVAITRHRRRRVV